MQSVVVLEYLISTVSPSQGRQCSKRGSAIANLSSESKDLLACLFVQVMQMQLGNLQVPWT